MFMKTIVALSLAILAVAAPQPEAQPRGELRRDYGTSGLNPCSLGASLTGLN